MNIVFYVLIILLLVLWLESPQGVLTNSLIVRKKDPAERLEEWLKTFNWTNRSQLTVIPQLPQYKFYSGVVEHLLGLARKLGGQYTESLMYLRQGLMNDRQFEKKLKEIIRGIWLQMGMMMALTWIFISTALSMVDVKVPLSHLTLIFSWQCLGLSLLPFFLGRYRLTYFGDIGTLWKILYILNSLARVPVARSEVMAMAGVGDLTKIRQASLLPLVEKLKDTCQRALKLGQSYEEDVKSQMEELRFQEKWHFELFEKRTGVLKLGLLSVFFLPSYLAFVFLLLGDLLTHF